MTELIIPLDTVDHYCYKFYLISGGHFKLCYQSVVALCTSWCLILQMWLLENIIILLLPEKRMVGSEGLCLTHHKKKYIIATQGNFELLKLVAYQQTNCLSSDVHFLYVILDCNRIKR